MLNALGFSARKIFPALLWLQLSKSKNLSRQLISTFISSSLSSLSCYFKGKYQGWFLFCMSGRSNFESLPFATWEICLRVNEAKNMTFMLIKEILSTSWSMQ